MTQEEYIRDINQLKEEAISDLEGLLIFARELLAADRINHYIKAKTVIRHNTFSADGRVSVLKDRKSKMLDSLVDNPELKDDIREKIEATKVEILGAEKAASQARDFEKDFDEFINFAFDFLYTKPNNWWQLEKETLKVYKQMVFPAGIQVTQDKKVYIPKVSPIYTYKNQKSPQNETISSEFVQYGGTSGA
jgi:hypothetical protein